MGPETKVTVLAVAVIVIAIAVYLIGITLNLRRTSVVLRGVQRGVGGIHDRAEPVGAVLAEIAAETGAIAGALTAVVARATGATEEAPEPMEDAVARARSAGPPTAVPARPAPGSIHEAVARAMESADEPADVASVRPARLRAAAMPSPTTVMTLGDGPATVRRRRVPPAGADRGLAIPARPGGGEIGLPDLEAREDGTTSMSEAVARAREAVSGAR